MQIGIDLLQAIQRFLFTIRIFAAIFLDGHVTMKLHFLVTFTKNIISFNIMCKVNIS
jgi:hypothetical protein